MINFHFNTRRLYSAYGQIIEVRYFPASGEATFYDLTRMVDGLVEIPPGLRTQDQIQAQVLSAYDKGLYRSGADTWEFAQECLRRWTKAMFEAQRAGIGKQS